MRDVLEKKTCITVTVNGIEKEFNVTADTTLRDILVQDGHKAVRDSDDREGFCGSDTVLLNGIPIYSNLKPALLCDGCEVVTPDSLGTPYNLSIVQQALIDSGVVQSAYNSPATALLLTWLLENNPHPSREEIKEALSGVFIRDAGYEHYYLAVKLAEEKMKYGKYKTSPSPSIETFIGTVSFFLVDNR